MNEGVALYNLLGGGLVEQFDHAMRQVVLNIRDPNTVPTAPRAIAMTVIFKPDEARSKCDTRVSCVAKLAPDAPAETTVYVGVSEGVPAAYEHNPKQMKLMFDKQSAAAAEV